MRALNPQFELLDATRLLAGIWSAGVRRDSNLPGWRKSAGAEKNAKQWERTQGVLENKGHYLFERSKLRAFGAQFSSHQALKGATNSAFCQNAPKPSGSQAKAETGTNSRLDRLRVLVGSELTSQGKDFSRRCHSDPERSEGEESRSQNEGTARFLVVRQLTDSLE